jgi:hypothetical protein
MGSNSDSATKPLAISKHLPLVLVSHGCVTKYHTLDGFNIRKVLPHTSGGQMSKMKVWTGLVPSDCVREGPHPVLSSWLLDGTCSLCLHAILLCRSVSKCLLFMRTLVILD